MNFFDAISIKETNEKLANLQPIFTLINNIVDLEFKKALFNLYSSNLKEWKIVASILNAAYTQDKTTFCLSREGFISLIKADPNCPGLFKSINNTVWGQYRDMLTQTEDPISKRSLKPLLRELKPAVKGPPGFNKAAIFQIIESQFVLMMAKKVGMQGLDLQEKNVVKFYDDKIIANQIPSFLDANNPSKFPERVPISTPIYQLGNIFCVRAGDEYAQIKDVRLDHEQIFILEDAQKINKTLKNQFKYVKIEDCDAPLVSESKIESGKLVITKKKLNESFFKFKEVNNVQA